MVNKGPFPRDDDEHTVEGGSAYYMPSILVGFGNYRRKQSEERELAGLASKLQAIYKDDKPSRLLCPFSKGSGFVEKDAWFNDSLIYDYLTAIAKKYSQRFNIEIGILQDDGFSVNNNQIKRQRTENSQARENLVRRADLIFWPINNDNHWYLMVIDKRQRGRGKHRAYMLDGKNCITTQGALMRQYCKPLERSLDLAPSKSLHQKILDQDNLYDCGPAICYWAKQICESTDPDFSMRSLSYTDFRQDIAQVLIDGAAENLSSAPSSVPSSVRSSPNQQDGCRP